MRKYFLLNIIVLFASATVFSQEVTIEEIRSSYESFEYQKVIDLSVKLELEKGDELSKDTLLEVYVMKAVSQYSLSREEEAKETFIKILEMDPGYNLNPVEISPKIIAFYEAIRRDYKTFLHIPEESEDTTKNYLHVETLYIQQNYISNAVARSIILPGWGHLYAGKSTKGWVFTSLSSLTAAGMIYFIIDTNRKEKNYLNEVDESLFREKHDAYNTSYKTRNWLIFSYVVVWLYSQFDLLFISDDIFSKEIIDTQFSVSPSEFQSTKLEFSVRVAF